MSPVDALGVNERTSSARPPEIATVTLLMIAESASVRVIVVLMGVAAAPCT